MKDDQLRIPFPDYPAAEQERDARISERKKQTDVYVMKVNGAWGGYLPRRRCSLTFNVERGVELEEFVGVVKEVLAKMKINPRFRCIQNQGVADHIMQQQFILKGNDNGRS